MPKATCSHPDGCDRPARKLGFCGLHYNRLRETGELGPVGLLRAPNGSRAGKTCSVVGCEEPLWTPLFCGVHYQRVRKNGEPGPAHLLKRRLPKEVRLWTAGQKHRFYKYGLTPEMFDAMLAAQGGRCRICGTSKPGGKGWSVDHCHATDAVRFIMCNKCNVAMGFLNEDPRAAFEMYRVLAELHPDRI